MCGFVNIQSTDNQVAARKPVFKTGERLLKTERQKKLKIHGMTCLISRK